MATNKTLLGTVRSVSARLIACRGFVTTNLNKGGISGDAKKDLKISVWWDVQKCQVPNDIDVGNVTRNMRDALRGIHYFGPLQFWAYGYMTLLPPHTLCHLHSRGVRLRHVPQGNELQDQVMIADMIEWTTNHPPPATHMLISEELFYPCDYLRLGQALDRLRVQGYDVLLVQPVEEPELQNSEPHPDPNFRVPKLAWQWETFLSGPKE